VPGRHDRATGHDEARPSHDALLEGLTQSHVRVACALGAEVAQGGEAGLQRGAQVIHGARHAQRLRLSQHLVVPRRLVVRVQQDV
jgi:hypothetical protein